MIRRHHKAARAGHDRAARPGRKPAPGQLLRGRCDLTRRCPGCAAVVRRGEPDLPFVHRRAGVGAEGHPDAAVHRVHKGRGIPRRVVAQIDNDRKLRPGGATVRTAPHHKVDVTIILQRLAALCEGEQRATRKLQQRRDAVDAVALLATLEEHRADRLLHRRTALARAARRA